CAKKPPPSDAPVPKSAPPPPSAAAPSSALPDASVGWTACTGIPVTADEAKKRRASLRAKPSSTTLHASAATARRDGSELAIGKARLAIHPWAKVVQT